jgi:hypothetical protein
LGEEARTPAEVPASVAGYVEAIFDTPAAAARC